MSHSFVVLKWKQVVLLFVWVLLFPKLYKKLASQHNCRIISTPHDTYMVARLISQSTPCRLFYENKQTFVHLKQKIL